MHLNFYTENCEVVDLPLSSVDKIVCDKQEIPLEKDFLLHLREADVKSCVVYFNSNNLGYLELNTDKLMSPIERINWKDITCIFFSDNTSDDICKLFLEWETDAMLTSHQFTRLQSVIEENGKFAFIHNETEIDMDYFFPEDEL